MIPYVTPYFKHFLHPTRKVSTGPRKGLKEELSRKDLPNANVFSTQVLAENTISRPLVGTGLPFPLQLYVVIRAT